MTDDVMIPQPTTEVTVEEYHTELYGSGEIQVPYVYAEDGSIDSVAMASAIEQAKKSVDALSALINSQINANTETTDGNQS